MGALSDKADGQAATAHYADERVTVHHGDCIEVMRTLPDGSVDSIVTDPPYGLGFMGKAWDALPPGEDWARECLRVLKPGGHLLAFGGTRTSHRLSVAVEDAGFEIRDSIAWLHSEGFPKNRASLKPSFEPVVSARKPFKGSLEKNKIAHGTGALDIEGCRIGGRWPANVALDDDMAEVLDVQSGDRPGFSGGGSNGAGFRSQYVGGESLGKSLATRTFGDSGGASRFFYVAKASKKERPAVGGITHPTVKPLALMQWLVRLVTPVGGTVLEPFAGSGSTVEACILEGFNCIAIEREAEYLPLIIHRIDRTGVLA